MDRSTVVIARFEDLVGRGLSSVLADEPHVAVVAEGVPAERLDAALAAHRPDVAILNFGALQAATEVHRLHGAHPGTGLVVLASRLVPAEAEQVLALGASACLGKDARARDVVEAIEVASQGLRMRARSLTVPVPEPVLLTPREADVLEHLRAERSNAEIALALDVGVETVRTHRRNIYRKLGVRTRRELRALLG